MTGNKKLIWLITNIPTPYRVPLFNELNRQMASSGYRLKIIFCAMGYPRRQWNINVDNFEFEWHCLGGRAMKFGKNGKTSFTFPHLIREFRKDRPAAVIVSGFSIATAKFWLLSFFMKSPYAIWSGEIGRRGVSLIFRIYRRRLVKRASAFVSYGTLAERYIISMGADSERCFIAINTVDTEYFLGDGGAGHGQKSISEGDTKHFICVGDLIPGKRPDCLIHAIGELAKSRRDFILDFVGDGQEHENLQHQSKRLGVEDLVIFHGYLQRSEVAEKISAATCMLFPSKIDVWGLVLVEGMAAGKPCISSVFAGATSDLIEDGVTGFTSDFSDKCEIARRMAWILDNPDKAQQIGRNAQELITKSVNLKVSAAGILDTVRYMFNHT